MKTRLSYQIIFLFTIMISCITYSKTYSQKVEVLGELKVTQMNENQSGEKLVIQNADGTLGTRNVESLPQAGLPIDSTRNLASDFELQKLLCDCPNPSPLLMKKLLESGYSPEDLITAGLPPEDVINATRSGILIDSRDKKAYKTVEIGAQIWMAENLNFGTPIDATMNPTNNSIVEKHCYDNDPTNCQTYGGLYQWDEAMQYLTTESVQGVCPDGWHLPSDAEWKVMEIHLGMIQAQADALLYRGTDQGSQIGGNETLWANGALDQSGVFGSSGFEGLPGGYVSGGSFFQLSADNYFWVSNDDNTSAWFRSLGFTSIQIYRATTPKTHGYSIRCIRD
jgi:uncharacterized protein (TIGR02145 family)